MSSWFILAFVVTVSDGFAKSLADSIQQIKPSVVGVATYLPTRSPPVSLLGTGFVVDDGYHVVTNAHVIPTKLNLEKKERLVVLYGQGNKPSVREARVFKTDEPHDLALLRLKGSTLKPLTLGDSSKVREGNQIAFTGFPIGLVLGLYPATHHGIVASITPVAIPVMSAKELDVPHIQRLRSPYNVFQLDATAYPGNSGSPVFLAATGEVIGIVNKVFVKQTKESVLAKPSGITYAIPISHVKALIQRK
ncbi:trypsin-like peptidase domain-containing protein [Endozoicomonas sp. SM1973]|uniref:Trypsin-like peptidase domain-containing protein n=1 Tax=Spartinivicinus marinus TaxID=2994442 RepID=A0A853I4Q4_9GAMM|nr:serine protease [Spartinivicinus marinus]MCX4024967.1 serine protease [Spartinivicinus marinus]NYZ67659.1 trypsin-like peptidase domain-containing protein [Spartinivicinus marinus]